MKPVLAIIAIFLSGMMVGAQVKRADAPARKPAFARSLQVVIVTNEDWDKTTGTASLFERKSSNSQWKRNGKPITVVLGRSGLANDGSLMAEGVNVKREGDGSSPSGMFPLTSAFGTLAKTRNTKLPYTKLEEFTECVDDPKSSFYNRIVNRMQVGNFDWNSSEKMLSIVPDYDLGVFVAYNTYPVEKGRGSCIFLHIWKDANSPTAGCTAMERRDLERIIGWLSPSKNPYLVQMPKKVYELRQRSLKLPKLDPQ